MSRCTVCGRNINGEPPSGGDLCTACRSLFEEDNVLMYCRGCGSRVFAPASALDEACSPRERGLVKAALRGGERRFSVNECPRCGGKG